MPFAILAALSLAAAAPVPTYQEAVQCAAVYQLSGNVKSSGHPPFGFTNVGQIGLEWHAHAALIRPPRSNSLADLARQSRAIVQGLLKAKGIRGWEAALAPARDRCVQLQAGLPDDVRKRVQAIQAGIAEVEAAKVEPTR